MFIFNARILYKFGAVAVSENVFPPQYQSSWQRRPLTSNLQLTFGQRRDIQVSVDGSASLSSRGLHPNNRISIGSCNRLEPMTSHGWSRSFLIDMSKKKKSFLIENEKIDQHVAQGNARRSWSFRLLFCFATSDLPMPTRILCPCPRSVCGRKFSCPYGPSSRSSFL